MKLAFILAWKNLIGAGLRTWLNVFVLSIAFLLILFQNGFLDGWNLQSKQDSIAYDFGEGQIRHENYDPDDILSISTAHAPIPTFIPDAAEPIFLHPGAIYPEERMTSVVLKGIARDQEILSIPTEAFDKRTDNIPVLIGSYFAGQMGIQNGDVFVMRWRDKNGTYDARRVEVIDIFTSGIPTVEMNSIFLPLSTLWEISGYEEEASYFVLSDKSQMEAIPDEGTRWEAFPLSKLSKPLDDIIRSKRASGAIMYLILLGIALLAIFDTQVLSIFRRQKEIGTYIALGVTRRQVVGLFTMEGTMYSIFAILLAAIYGTPILWYFSTYGIELTDAFQNSGFPMRSVMTPVFGLFLILGTILLVVLSACIVSYMPSRKIAKMNPVQALKGKIQ